jgi:hypothetical protein
MKKTKIYFIIPIIVLGIFYAYYWNFRSTYEAHQAEIAQVEKDKRLERQRLEAVAREASIHDAIEAQKTRKAERIAREEKDRQQKDAKENAKLEAEKADQEAQKLERQAEKLKKDVETAKEEIVQIQANAKRSNEELVFLKQYTEEAIANQAKLTDVMSKIVAADAAAEKAAAAALAAAKKNQ